jgi:hypothetical protein
MKEGKSRDNSMYGFQKEDVKGLTRRLNNFDNLKFGMTIPNNMDRKRPGSRVSMSGERVSPEYRKSSVSVIAAPSGL